MADLALAGLRAEAAMLRARHAAEQNEVLAAVARKHEEWLRSLNERLIERTCRLSVSELVALREEAAFHWRALLRLTDE